MTFSLYEVAPRLARARDERVEELRAEELRARKLATMRLRLERLVAHRELQLIRAGARRDRRYIGKRDDKLAAARHALKSVVAAQRELGR